MAKRNRNQPDSGATIGADDTDLLTADLNGDTENEPEPTEDEFDAETKPVDEEIPEMNEDGTRNVVLDTSITADKSAEAKAPFTGVERTYKQTIRMPGTTQGYIDKYGEEVVRDLLESAVTARARAACRKPLEEGWSDADIEALVNDRVERFGTRKSRAPRDPRAAIREKLAALQTKEERQAYLDSILAEFED